MPTIDVEIAELERLLGLSVNNTTKLDDLLSLVKGEAKIVDEKEGILSIEMKDTNRPDLWGVEGLARGLQGFLGRKKGLIEYSVGEVAVDIEVDPRLQKIRPFIGCCIIEDVKLTDAIIRGLMHLQDKLDQTNGRNRQKTSIGLYDFSLITPPLSYTASQPKETSFVPLGFTEKMTLAEILEKHPKGIEYGHIVRKHKVYPMLLDSKNQVLSFPPIINSNDLGKVTEKTRNLLIEVTGTSHDVVLSTVNLVSLALIDRGGKAYAASIHYKRDDSKIVTPSFSGTPMRLKVGFVNRLLGLELSAENIVELLSTAGFGAIVVDAAEVRVMVPCYRTDVMHQVDLVEDVAIAYGYNNIEAIWRDLPTTGYAKPKQRLLDKARGLMVGLGFQEILTNTLTNPDSLFAKMNVAAEESSALGLTGLVEIANPKLMTMTCLRNWLLPSLMAFLSSNKSVEFPQRIFELGKITVRATSVEVRTLDEDKIAAVVSHPTANFTEIKSMLDAFLMNMGIAWRIEPSFNPSFIEGRSGDVIVDDKIAGTLGEINPLVLASWNLENPAAAFEVDVGKLVHSKTQ